MSRCGATGRKHILAIFQHVSKRKKRGEEIKEGRGENRKKLFECNGYTKFSSTGDSTIT